MTAEGFIHVLLNSNLKTKSTWNPKTDRYQNLHMGGKVSQQRKDAYAHFLTVIEFYNQAF